MFSVGVYRKRLSALPRERMPVVLRPLPLTTTVYRADNAAVQYIGRISDVTTERRMTGGGTEMRFRVYGRSLVINANCQQTGTNTMKWSVDGGAYTDYNFGATGVQNTTDLLGTGSDGWHDIIIICKTASTYRLTIASAITVGADSTPDIAAHSEVWTVSLLGTTGEFTDLVANATLGSNKRGHTFGTTSTSFGHSSPSMYKSTFQDECIYFRASCTKLAVWHSGPGPYVVYRDGLLATTTPVVCTSANDPPALCVLLASEDGTEHEYRVIEVSSNSNNNYCDAVCILGTFSSTSPTLNRRVAFLGDSTTACIHTTANSAQGFVAKLIGEYGLIGFNRGIAGNTTAQMQFRLTADVLGIAEMYSVVVVSGANDGAVADATLQSQMESIYNSILSDDAATLVEVCETFPSSTGNRETVVIQAAVAAVADSRCVYRGTDGWIVGTIGVDTHDGQHLNDSGGTKIAVQMASFVVGSLSNISAIAAQYYRIMMQ